MPATIKGRTAYNPFRWLYEKGTAAAEEALTWTPQGLPIELARLENEMGLLSGLLKVAKKAVKYAPVVASVVPMPGGGLLGKVISTAAKVSPAAGGKAAVTGGVLDAVIKQTMKKAAPRVAAKATTRVIPGAGVRRAGDLLAGAAVGAAAGVLTGETAAELRRMIRDGRATQSPSDEAGIINVWDSETGALLGTIKRARKRKTTKKRKSTSKRRTTKRRTTRRKTTKRRKSGGRKRATPAQAKWRREFVRRYAGR